MWRLRAGRPQADLADALVYRHKHDIHYAHAPDTERQGADEGQQNLQSIVSASMTGRSSSRPNIWKALGSVGEKFCVATAASTCPIAFFELRRGGLKHHHGGIGVPQIARR